MESHKITQTIKFLTSFKAAILIITFFILFQSRAMIAYAEQLSYLNSNASSATSPNATLITAATTTLTDGWYYTSGELFLSHSLVVSGDVHIILTDNSSLSITPSNGAGIQVSKNNSLTIYGQSTNDEMGRLEAKGSYSSAGIGGAHESSSSGLIRCSGTITINGGHITATGGYSAAGIGGAGLYWPDLNPPYHSDNDTIIINGGTIVASTSNSIGDPAGIGGGSYGEPGIIEINGGNITATGSHKGIGGGSESTQGLLTIRGGIINANGLGVGNYGEFLPIHISGNAIIQTPSIYLDTVYTGGLVILGSTGTLYGDVLLSQDFTLNSDVVLNIPTEHTLAIASNAVLTNEGVIENKGSLEISGNLENNGTIYNLGVINGSISGKPYLLPLNTATIAPEFPLTYSYTGTNIEPELLVNLSGNNLNKNIDYIVSYQNNINIGKATVTIEGIGKYYGSISKDFQIEKGNLSVQFDSIFTYDGSLKSVAIVGELPSGISVSYTNNNKINAGSYTVTASFSGENPNYNIPSDKSITLTIHKAEFTNVTFDDGAFTYDGLIKSLAIEGTLPDGILVSYHNNEQVNAGSYTVTASFSGESLNYTASSDKSATLTIDKAEFNKITFDDKDFNYDGITKSLAVTGTLPDGILVSYHNNEQINAGSYPVTASFSGESLNYMAPSDLAATLTIHKVAWNNISFENGSFPYDGLFKLLTITGTLPDGILVSYHNNEQINVGSYLVTASFSGESLNYTAPSDLTATLTINKVTQDLIHQASALDGGSTIALTVTIPKPKNGELPTGNIAFISNNILLDTSTLSNASATYYWKNPSVGTHNFTIYYAGDQNYNETSLLIQLTIDNYNANKKLSVLTKAFRFSPSSGNSDSFEDSETLNASSETITQQNSTKETNLVKKESNLSTKKEEQKQLNDNDKDDTKESNLDVQESQTSTDSANEIDSSDNETTSSSDIQSEIKLTENKNSSRRLLGTIFLSASDLAIGLFLAFELKKSYFIYQSTAVLHWKKPALLFCAFILFLSLTLFL